jgi:hypothetical protein
MSNLLRLFVQSTAVQQFEQQPAITKSLLPHSKTTYMVQQLVGKEEGRESSPL